MAPTSFHLQRISQQASVPQNNALKLENESLLHKVSGHLSKGYFPGADESLYRPFTKHFLAPHSLVGFMNRSPIGLQTWMFWGLLR